MKLIFGGAYQGKLAFALKNENLTEKEVYTFKKLEDCETPMECIELADVACRIPADAKVLDHFERFTYACAADEKDALAYIRENPKMWEGRIVICDDVSQGVVPMDHTERAWREMNGRCLAYLAAGADEVYRVFCGIPQRIKPE